MLQHQQAQIRKILFYVDYITERISYGVLISYLLTIPVIITGKITHLFITQMNFGLDITNLIQMSQSITLVLAIGLLLNQEMD